MTCFLPPSSPPPLPPSSNIFCLPGKVRILLGRCWAGLGEIVKKIPRSYCQHIWVSQCLIFPLPANGPALHMTAPFSDPIRVNSIRNDGWSTCFNAFSPSTSAEEQFNFSLFVNLNPDHRSARLPGCQGPTCYTY